MITFKYKYFLFLIIFCLWNCHQRKFTLSNDVEKKLYYFTNADTTKVGVRDENGKIIIPLSKSLYVGYDYKNPVKEQFLEFLGSVKNKNYREHSPRIIAGEVYDREGNFLYYPQWFDNGFDYFEEGFRRFVEGEKMGFVDKAGKKIIPAQWDFAGSFSYGYATVYSGGWEKKYEKGGEHWRISPTSAGSESYLINKKGEKVKSFPTKKSERDYFHDGRYYPDPFIYNDFEQNIVDQLNGMSVLNDINTATCGNCTPKKDWILKFEITERPNKADPYYTLKGYVHQNKQDEIISVSVDGKEFFHEDFVGEKIPLNLWIKNKLQELKKYFKSHPDKANRFDID